MNARSKVSTDQNNNLSIEKNGRKLSARGRFSADRHNRLVYWLNENSAWRRKNRLGRVFVFEGKWRLNANHDLQLQLDKSEPWQRDSVLTLKGDLISAEKDKLVFRLKSKDSRDRSQFYFLKLTGTWQADKSNRIIFSVKKVEEPADILVLNGSWKVNQNQEIVYTYEKTNLKTKTKISHNLIFSGYWQINSAQRLTYILSWDCDSCLDGSTKLAIKRQQYRGIDFRGQIESPNLYPAEGMIKYRLGIGKRLPGVSGVPREVYLYGTWKFSRKFELSFQMDYGRGRVQKILFDTQIHINNRNEIVVSLNNSRNEALGLCLIFTHKFLKKFDAQTFLRLEARGKEQAVKTGVRIPF